MRMNRKEFKQLLVEWNQNFINEKNISTFGVDFKGLSEPQELFVKEVPIDLNLYALGDFVVPVADLKSFPSGSINFSHFMFDVLSRSKYFEKRLTKAIVLDKASIRADIIPVLREALRKLSEVGFSYEGFQGDIVSLGIDSNKTKENVKKIISDLEKYDSKPEGLVLYFARMSGSIEDMADGTVNMASTIKDDAVWKNSLQWELKHDLFHAFEDVLAKDESYANMLNLSFDPDVSEIIKNFNVPNASGGSSGDGSIEFSSSTGDGDNFASLVPYIRSLGKTQASVNKFIEKCNLINKDIFKKDLTIEGERKLRQFFDFAHRAYDKIGELLQGKVIIQKAHG